jgi:hypothetical protein
MQSTLRQCRTLLLAALPVSAGVAQQPAQWTLREIGTVGAEHRPAIEGRLYSVIADAQGNIYASYSEAREVRAFDPQGRLLWTVGGQGSAAGKFATVSSIGWLGDTIVVPDAANYRIALLSRSGAWLGQLYPWPMPASRLFLAGSDIYSAVRARDDSGRVGHRYFWLGRDRVDSLPFILEVRKEGIACRSIIGTSFISLPYPIPTLTVLAPGGLYAVAATARYRIAFVNPRGDTVRTIEKAHQPLPISDAQWADATEPLRRALARSPMTLCDAKEFRRPSHLPAIQDLFFDAEGRLWVETWTTTARVFDIFDLAGRHIATAPAMKWAGFAPYVRGDRFYLIQNDSSGPSVKVYVIDR